MRSARPDASSGLRPNEATAGLIDRLARRIEDAIARESDAEAEESGGPLAA